MRVSPVHRVAIVAMAGMLACSTPTREAGGGELTAEWVGTDTGGISGRPDAFMCLREGRLKITVVKGDLGLGLIVYSPRGFQKGNVPIVDIMNDTMTIPRVGVAARWIKEKAVVALQSDSGTLLFDTSATGLGATFTAHMRGVNTTDTVTLTGHYGGLVPERCPNDSTTPPQRRRPTTLVE